LSIIKGMDKLRDIGIDGIEMDGREVRCGLNGTS
jgi:hypothetical protein